ncbi:addiction module protein [Caldimonas brevitalea]|uniref:Addiction module antitoxin RelB n=1 Tax=Caldimonas brevitalea TaxID=413882 RepID=A0A0G3BKE3_9BURK|nr:addiction module protein [Caldimonas brevitalea]AKJ28463.1 hypothetical protein AAW51_1772 [Caldimonas brevitalea]
MNSLAKIRDEIRSLTEEERAELALHLLQSLEASAATPDIERRWNEEAARRLAEYDRGQGEAIPAEEVHAQALGRLKQ